MIFRKVATLSLVLLPSLFQVIVHGKKHHLIRKVTADINNTTDLYDPDESINTYPLSYDHDNSNVINNEAEFYLYNSTDSYNVQETDSFEGGGGFERHLQSKGDWSLCSTSSECASRCCSGKYSNRIPKCTPLGSGFDPISNGCISGGGSNSGGGNSGGVVPVDGNPWVNAHNVRRQRYHTRYGKSYVPLKWSASLANDARAWANNLVGSCELKHASYGENLAMQSWNGSPDSVLTMWTEQEDPGNGRFIWPNSGHFSQVLWRGTKYVGCGTASRSGCTIHVCRYRAPGNCNLLNNLWRWAEVVFADSSGCGPQCPAEGCF